MTTIQRSLLLAAAMMLTAVAAIFDYVPAAFAEYAPLAWLVLLPWAIGPNRAAKCRAGEAQ